MVGLPAELGIGSGGVLATIYLGLPAQGCDVLHSRTPGRATEAEIHRANQKLKQAGQRSRYVAARHLGHHGRGQG